MTQHFDTIVIGGGTMGTAAAWELGKRGEKALVLEQFSHVHALGSHSGQTRKIRHAYAEGPDYIPYVLHADDLWLELEEAAGVKVLHRVGSLEMIQPGGAHAASDSAAVHSIPYEWVSLDEARKRWPMFAIPDGWEVGFSPTAGFLDVETALHAMGDQARVLGVKIRENQPVRSWEIDGDGVRVRTDQGEYTADKLIVTAGAWASRMLADLGLPLHVLRKLLFWLEVEDESPFANPIMPTWGANSPWGGLYGFPIFGQPGLKLARHDGGERTDPETIDREVKAGEEEEVMAFARAIFPGITGRVIKSAACMYTVTPDENFIVDRHPEHSNVAIGAGFSGHGFKFATAVGETLVDLVSEPLAKPMPILAIDRF